MKLSDFAKQIHATLHGQDGILPEVCHDTRKLTAGQCYVAIQGEQFDGHAFIEDAIKKGAVCVIASRAPQTALEQSVPFLQVEDTVKALGEMGHIVRLQSKARIVGLTGSCGKTTVKGMIDAICVQNGKTLSTQGNFNNHIGLPLTLLKLDPSYEYAVIEMGANHMGEIKYLCSLAKPNITLINNVRPAHLLGFGTIENVAKAKGEIYDALDQDGIAVINLEEAFVPYWQGRLEGKKIITFGLNNQATIWASDIKLEAQQVQFKVHTPNDTADVTVNIPGQHTVLNALAAMSCGFALNIPLAKMVAGLAAFQGVPGRMRSMTGVAGTAIIDDSYNANPGSVKAAIEVLAHRQGKRLLVLGDMGELGENAIQYHADIGRYAKEQGIDQLYAVGNLTPHTVEAFGAGAQSFASKDELVQVLKSRLDFNTTVLIKGSRSQKMEVVTQALTIGEK